MFKVSSNLSGSYCEDESYFLQGALEAFRFRLTVARLGAGIVDIDEGDEVSLSYDGVQLARYARLHYWGADPLDEDVVYDDFLSFLLCASARFLGIQAVFSCKKTERRLYKDFRKWVNKEKMKLPYREQIRVGFTSS